MEIERIKKITMLTTLKGTDKGKPIYWLAGDKFYPDKEPLPQSILRELSTKRRGGPILDIEYKPEPESPPLVLEEKPEKEASDPEENPDVNPDDVKDVTPKKEPPKKSAKAPARRRTQKK